MICKQNIANLDFPDHAMLQADTTTSFVIVVMSGTGDWNNHEHDDHEVSITIMMICYWTYNLIKFDSHHYLYHLSSLSVLSLSHKQHHTPSSLMHETSNTIILSSLFMKAMRSRSKNITLIDVIISVTNIIIWVVVSFVFFNFHPYLEKCSNLTSIFFKWLETTN